MSKQVLFVAVLMLALPLGASASDSKILEVGASFPAEKQRIEADLAEGKTYSEISAEDASKVRAALSRISYVLETSGGAEALNEADKVKVFNDQQVVITILTKAGEESRLICVRERTLGSQRLTSQCRTVAQRRQQLEEARNSLETSQRAVRQGKIL